MTEMAEKKGKLKVTVEVEVNEELMDFAKDAISKMPMRMQEMWKGQAAKRKNKPSSSTLLFFPLFLKSFFKLIWVFACISKHFCYQVVADAFASLPLFGAPEFSFVLFHMGFNCFDLLPLTLGIQHDFRRRRHLISQRQFALPCSLVSDGQNH